MKTPLRGHIPCALGAGQGWGEIIFRGRLNLNWRQGLARFQTETSWKRVKTSGGKPVFRGWIAKIKGSPLSRSAMSKNFLGFDSLSRQQ